MEMKNSISVHHLPVGSVRSIITLNNSSSSATTLVTKNVVTNNCHRRRSSWSLQQQQQQQQQQTPSSSSYYHDHQHGNTTHRRRMRNNNGETYTSHINFMAMTKKNCGESSQAVATMSYYRCRKSGSINEKNGIDGDDEIDINDDGQYQSSTLELVTIVAAATTTTTTNPSAKEEGNGGGGRISIAVTASAVANIDPSSLLEVNDEPLLQQQQKCRVLGVKKCSHALTNKSSSFLSLCLIPIRNKNTYTFLSSQQQRQQQQQQSPHPILVAAIDTLGTLQYSTINIKDDDGGSSNYHSPLVMQECQFNIGNSTYATVLSQLMSMMNTLTVRLELEPSVTTATASTSLSNTSSTSTNDDKSFNAKISSPTRRSPNRNARKRKQSPVDDDDDDDDDKNMKTTICSDERIYLIATNLNDNTYLPSESPPIIMLLSYNNNRSADFREESSCEMVGQTWTIIPGLENVNVSMTCVLFVSRKKSGPLVWNIILSAMMEQATEQQERSNDDALVLMGFKDGTLRASYVATANQTAGLNGSSRFDLDVGNATLLLQLSSNEPLISIHLLPTSLSSIDSSIASSSQSSTIICVGALGTIITLASSTELLQEDTNNRHCDSSELFSVDYKIEPYGGRWLSLTCVECYVITNKSTNLSFVGVNDTGQTFLHCICILRRSQQHENESRQEVEQKMYRLPIPTKMARAIQAAQIVNTGNHISSYISFTLTSPSGTTTLMRMPIPQGEFANQPTDSLHCRRRRSSHHGTNSSILSVVRGETLLDQQNTPQERKQHRPSTLMSLLQQFDLANAKQNKNEARQEFDSICKRLDQATKEIRDVTRIASYITNPPLFVQNSSPMQFVALQYKNGVIESEATFRKLQLSKQSSSSSITEWIPSIHILQSRIHGLSPLLRPQSMTEMLPLCYRKKQNGKHIKVLSGGTATSYNGCDFDVDVGDGGTMKISIPTVDLMPVSIYASTSMIYADTLCASIAYTRNSWRRSETITDTSNGSSGLSHSPRNLWPVVRSTANASARASKGFDGSGFLGVSLAFEVVGKDKDFATLDILTYCFTGTCVGESTLDDVSRETAEKHVQQWYQNQSSALANSRKNAYVFPLLKEQQLLRRSAVGNSGTAKVYCCSSMVRCTEIDCNTNHQVSGKMTYCVNIGFGPINLLFHSSDKADSSIVPENDVYKLAFAIGSNLLTPNESMSFVPLIRQAIIRRVLEQHYLNRQCKTSKDYVSLLQEYHKLLNDKQTKKIVKYILRTLHELLVNIDKTTSNECPTTVLSSVITLYGIMRAMSFSFQF